MRCSLPLIVVLAGCNSCAHTQHVTVTRGDQVEIKGTHAKVDLPSNPFPSNDPKAIDPWAVTPGRVDDPPTLAERHKIAEQACPIVKAPFFYSIEKAGKVNHILGTRHISVSLAKFPKDVTTAIASAKLAVFEVAPDDKGSFEDSKISIKDTLGPDLWKRYTELVGSTAADSMEEATPAQAMIWLIAMYEDVSAMLDSEIQNTVQAAKIPAIGLETSEFQDRLLEKLLDARMLKAEVAHTKDRAELAKESRDDLSEYCAGTDDKPGMDDDTRKNLLDSGYTAAEIDSIDDQMVYSRNASWIPKLEKLFDKGDVFVAVGADHLIGARGVVALLAKDGFTVKRVPRN